MTKQTIALISIARPTFDVPLAQSVADTALQQLTNAGFSVVGTRNELLMDAAAAERAIAELQNSNFDLLILLQASFADSSMAVQIATALAQNPQSAISNSKPPPSILLWAVPDAREGGRLRLNSLCGINLTAHAFLLAGLKYDYLLCRANDPSALTKITTLARAGAALKKLQGARIGLIGAHPVGFDTCRYDATALSQLFGSEVVSVGLPGFLFQSKRAEQPDRDQFLQRVRMQASNLGELDQGATNGTAGVYVALRQLADSKGLSGVAVRCWPEFFTELGCAACGAMSVMNEEKCPASCEADVNGTLTSLLLQTLSDSHAFLTDLVSIDGETNSGVLWHCGLAPFSMADPEHGIVGTIHSNRKLPLLFEFPLKPGRVTIARLHRVTIQQDTDRNSQFAIRNSYQLVIGGGEMVRAPKSFTGTSGVIRFDRPALEVFDTVMCKGLEHHFSITYGDVREELRAVARLVGIEVLELT
ncbi:MAG: hypothetical protein U0175_16330 [Caldilineaceae bacterium]